MIIPQSQTFNVLKTRLDCVNITNFSLPFIEDEQQAQNPVDKEANRQFILKSLELYEEKQVKLREYH